MQGESINKLEVGDYFVVCERGLYTRNQNHVVDKVARVTKTLIIGGSGDRFMREDGNLAEDNIKRTTTKHIEYTDMSNVDKIFMSGRRRERIKAISSVSWDDVSLDVIEEVAKLLKV